MLLTSFSAQEGPPGRVFCPIMSAASWLRSSAEDNGAMRRDQAGVCLSARPRSAEARQGLRPGSIAVIKRSKMTLLGKLFTFLDCKIMHLFYMNYIQRICKYPNAVSFPCLASTFVVAMTMFSIKKLQKCF